MLLFFLYNNTKKDFMDEKKMIRKKKKRLPLKIVYYLSFLFFIVIPILVVLVLSLLSLNQQFKSQAVENIERAQETIITDLKSDIVTMSMRLSHLIYTNNNEILAYAAGTDVSDSKLRYENNKKLAQAGNLALEPVKNIVSVGFYMKSGKKTHIKNEINRSYEQIRETDWYQAALQTPNSVRIGSYDTTALNDLFSGGKKDMFILVFALAPDVTTDRSEKIEMVTFYQSAGVADRIKTYNRNYLNADNKLGMTRIVDENGRILFSTMEETGEETGITGLPMEEAEAADGQREGYTTVRTPIELENAVWYIESTIQTRELTADYWGKAVFMLGAAVVILLLAGYYSGYFIKNIVKPVEEISGGLRQVEEGNLDVHITPSGQFEVRTMIHQFNAMVKRLKVLIGEYEEKMRGIQKTPEECFSAMINGEITPEEKNRSWKEFFAEHYTILGIEIDSYGFKEKETDYGDRLINCFARNALFASRCIPYKESKVFFLVFYRIAEEDFLPKAIKMLEEIQKSVKQEFGLSLSCCIGPKKQGMSSFSSLLTEIRNKICLCLLKGESPILDLNQDADWWNQIVESGQKYEKLANALYTADEKNMIEEREHLFDLLSGGNFQNVHIDVYGALLAIGKRFSSDNGSFTEVFGQRYDYLSKVSRIEDFRSLKLWLTNYFTWIMNYSASKLNVAETDIMIRAKRYLADRFENPDLTLAEAAEYIGLNEKYFSNRFTKETGETFSSYLTGLRMQKARELLKTTSFKVYEIAEMSGYHNVEHFNRMFKKINGVSPAQFRKTM